MIQLKTGFKYLIKQCSYGDDVNRNIFDAECITVLDKYVQFKLYNGHIIWKETKYISETPYAPAGYYCIIESLGESNKF